MDTVKKDNSLLPRVVLVLNYVIKHCVIKARHNLPSQEEEEDEGHSFSLKK
jgi:hypothetical protein